MRKIPSLIFRGFGAQASTFSPRTSLRLRQDKVYAVDAQNTLQSESVMQSESMRKLTSSIQSCSPQTMEQHDREKETFPNQIYQMALIFQYNLIYKCSETTYGKKSSLKSEQSNSGQSYSTGHSMSTGNGRIAALASAAHSTHFPFPVGHPAAAQDRDRPQRTGVW